VATFYGHGSSIALVIFVGLFAMRVFSSQRRRRVRPGGSYPARSFTDPAGSGARPDGVDAPSGEVAFTGIAAGWLIDPSGRHEQRYWSGSEWTEHVRDGGVPGTDPPPGGATRDASS
jgi:hypothetical protein